MATHRAMQAAGMAVTAAAPLSGPYTLSAFADAIFEGEVNLSATENFALLVTSYQHAYGNVYAAPTDVFNAAYAADITTLLPSTTPMSQLEAAGKIPASRLFNSTPPAAAYAGITPATTPAGLAPAFQPGFGPGYLITNAYRLNYLEDAQAAPDGGFPTITDGLPPSNPKNTLRQDLKTNDLRTWVPAAPVLLCGGNSDPSVFYLNTQLMQHYWVASAANAPVTVLDVDSPAAANDPYAALKNEFVTAKDLVIAAAVAGGATDGGVLAVLEAYHAGLSRRFASALRNRFSTRASAEGRRPHLLVKLGTDAAGGRIIAPCSTTLWAIRSARSAMPRLRAVDDFIEGFLAYETRAEGILAAADADPGVLHCQRVCRIPVDAPRGARRGPRASKYLASAEREPPRATRREQLNTAVLRAWAADDLPRRFGSAITCRTNFRAISSSSRLISTSNSIAAIRRKCCASR